MSSIEAAGAYLKSVLDAKGQSKAASRQPTLPFVTISREAGAGGHEVSRLLFDLLDKDQRDPPWSFVDAAFCQKALADAKVEVTLKELADNVFRSDMEDAIYQMVGRHSPQDVVYYKIFGMMRLLARRGRVILVGRGGTCATSGLSQGLHFRLVAPLEARIARMKTLLGVTEKAARKTIAAQDAVRSRLIRHYFNQDIEDSHLYHAVWNTEKMSPAQISSLIIAMIAERERAASALS